MRPFNCWHRFNQINPLTELIMRIRSFFSLDRVGKWIFNSNTTVHFPIQKKGPTLYAVIVVEYLKCTEITNSTHLFLLFLSHINAYLHDNNIMNEFALTNKWNEWWTKKSGQNWRHVATSNVWQINSLRIRCHVLFWLYHHGLSHVYIYSHAPQKKRLDFRIDSY